MYWYSSLTCATVIGMTSNPFLFTIAVSNEWAARSLLALNPRRRSLVLRGLKAKPL